MAEAKMKQADPQDGQNQQELKEVNAAVTPRDYSKGPNLPIMDLLNGPRKAYLEIGVPLYEASIKCDWKAAKKILENTKLELVKYGITENGETALHIAASAKIPGKVKEFVANLMKKMTKEDVAFENENYNTALYLAAGAGNIKTVKIMLKKNEKLLAIPGGGSKNVPPTLMPIYTAALFGNHNVVRYMYKQSNDLVGNHWTHLTRGWLLEKCVENNMFDIALKIVTKYPEHVTGNALGVLARKPEAFRETEFNFIQRIISWGQSLYSKSNITPQTSQNGNESVPEDLDRDAETTQDGNESVPEDLDRDAETKSSIIRGIIKSGKLRCSSSSTGRTIKSVITYISSKVVPPEKDNGALQLLSFIWNKIAEMPKKEIDNILRGAAEFKVVDKQATVNADQGKLLSCERCVKMYSEIDSVIKGPAAATSKNQITTRSFPSRVLFVAAEWGNTKFVIELIRQYPDLIWKVDDNNQSIFHIAAKHRHEGIYNLLYEIGSMKDMITPLKDNLGNNMLHLVGKVAKEKRLQNVSGVALQMQLELLWFKEVESMIPSSYGDKKNKEGLTPYELFTKEHKELVTSGETWMKETANQCMVVAALIATIVFAAAFTVPGGYDQNLGTPFFQSKKTLLVFVVADAISLFSSTASILIFLSILTSRYAERDFLESLPKKLMAGLATLFLSITTMTIIFSISFFVLYHKGLLWIPILIGVLAVMPVLLYVRLQIALFIDVIRSTYGSRYLFKPTKHVLYYDNPKV